MNEAPEILRRKFLQLFGWEKRKRRQEILTTLVCYSLLAALVLVPIYSTLVYTTGDFFSVSAIFIRITSLAP